ncbi:MAG: DJ-1/PfpI family protein [Leptospira sp.]|nr:DJ-1/PfpI family protein [Leptospira sp.]
MRLKIIYVLASILFGTNCSQLNEFYKTESFQSEEVNLPVYKTPIKKKFQAVIIANDKGTEITDLLIPFYFFSESGQFDVRIVSQGTEPIYVWKGLFLLPHMTLEMVDYIPDIIIVPAIFEPFDEKIIQFLTKHAESKILSICEGARLIGETNKFNHFSITSHSSAMDELQTKYPKLKWIKNKKYIVDRNLISTAGVSSAVEGSLKSLEGFIGKKETNKLMKKIHYPYASIQEDHNSLEVGFGDKIQILKKVIFDNDPKIGVELVDGADEFQLAAYLDAFNRTFPYRIETFGKQIVQSKNGLYFFKTGNYTNYDIGICANQCEEYQGHIHQKINMTRSDFYFDEALNQINLLYGKRFSEVTRKLLDYKQ